MNLVSIFVGHFGAQNARGFNFDLLRHNASKLTQDLGRLLAIRSLR
jgi:hypothetical protein